MRQYIGARYVPKYYENSLDPDSTEWESNVAYDPLTIVTLPNLHSYISKKFVPASVGTPADNREYWLDQGSESAYIEVLQQEIDDMKDGDVEGSLQNQIDGMKDGDVEGSLQNQIDVLGSNVTSNTNKLSVLFSKFSGKSICILGDSISDETTYPPNWVDAFTDIAESLGATVTNASITGTSVVGVGGDVTVIPAGHDIYIIALGVNDFQGQFNISMLRTAVANIAQRIDLTSHEAFYISPLKAFRSAYSVCYSPLSAYRYALENLFNEMGFTIISGDNVPRLSIYTERYFLADDLHPASIFKDIYANYVIEAIISGVSTYSIAKGYMKACAISESLTYASGSVTLTWITGNQYTITINMAAVDLTASTWTELGTVGDLGLCQYIDATGTSYDGNVFQFKIEQSVNTKLYITAPSTGTFNISLTLKGYYIADQSVS